jgi:hypothetical protein
VLEQFNSPKLKHKDAAHKGSRQDKTRRDRLNIIIVLLVMRKKKELERRAKIEMDDVTKELQMVEVRG